MKMDISRRALIAGSGGAAAVVAGAPAAAQPVRRPRIRPASTAIAELAPPVPPPAPIADPGAYINVNGARIWYWDSGGRGRPLLLAHPGTGSALIWGYQRDLFARAGYRVIAWSRRGFYRSTNSGGAPEPMGASDIDDLRILVTALGIRRFDAIGSAAGGGVMLRYAAAHPQQLRSLVIACSLGDVDDEEYAKLSNSLRPAAFMQMPAEFRELSPSYRAANPEGVRAWLALEKIARAEQGAPMPPPPGARSRGVTWGSMRSFRFPVLWLTGDADLYTPPPLLKLFHDRLPGSELAIIQGAGHSAYWEQPGEFNRVVLDFLARA